MAGGYCRASISTCIFFTAPKWLTHGAFSSWSKCFGRWALIIHPIHLETFTLPLQQNVSIIGVSAAFFFYTKVSQRSKTQHGSDGAGHEPDCLCDPAQVRGNAFN
jgi:hypothetical protein